MQLFLESILLLFGADYSFVLACSDAGLVFCIFLLIFLLIPLVVPGALVGALEARWFDGRGAARSAPVKRAPDPETGWPAPAGKPARSAIHGPDSHERVGTAGRGHRWRREYDGRSFYRAYRPGRLSREPAEKTAALPGDRRWDRTRHVDPRRCAKTDDSRRSNPETDGRSRKWHYWLDAYAGTGANRKPDDAHVARCAVAQRRNARVATVHRISPVRAWQSRGAGAWHKRWRQCDSSGYSRMSLEVP